MDLRIQSASACSLLHSCLLQVSVGLVFSAVLQELLLPVFGGIYLI